MQLLRHQPECARPFGYGCASAVKLSASTSAGGRSDDTAVCTAQCRGCPPLGVEGEGQQSRYPKHAQQQWHPAVAATPWLAHR